MAAKTGKYTEPRVKFEIVNDNLVYMKEEFKVETTEYRTDEGKLISRTVSEVRKENAKFSLGIQSFREYLKQGGNTLEYFAVMMTSGSEQVRIMGMEAIGLRRIMYGFLPRGTFRVVNQLATAFNFLGGTFRGTKDLIKGNNEEMEKSTGIFKTLIKLSATPLFDKEKRKAKKTVKV